jgi:hypothetical protein
MRDTPEQRTERTDGMAVSHQQCRRRGQAARCAESARLHVPRAGRLSAMRGTWSRWDVIVRKDEHYVPAATSPASLSERISPASL